MKLYKSKTQFSLLYGVLFFFFQSYQAQAQATGSATNGRSVAAEGKAADISDGSFSGDVSLFTGTYNSSYKLGTVSTASGLSFTANLSYSSTMASSDNMVNLSGVPYGEGWKLDVPTISVSTEDFNKYTPLELEIIKKNSENIPTSSPITEKTPTFSLEEAKVEGRLYWYAPTVNIPGVGGGRMVYKGLSAPNKHTFILNRFQRYIEAELDVVTRKWTVTIDDGSLYEFDLKIVTHRQASNQHAKLDDLSTSSSILTTEKDALANLILPKTEYSTWYCSKISNPNHVGVIILFCLQRLPLFLISLKQTFRETRCMKVL